MLDRREAFFAGIQECEIAPRTEGWREFRVEEVGLTMQFPGEWSDYDYRTDSAGNLLHGSAYGWFGSSSL